MWEGLCSPQIHWHQTPGRHISNYSLICITSKHISATTNTVMNKGVVLHSAISSPLDRWKCFTCHPLADLFIPTPTWRIWEAFSHAALTVQILFIRIASAVYSQVHIYTSEWTGASRREPKCLTVETAAEGITYWPGTMGSGIKMATVRTSGIEVHIRLNHTFSRER